MTTIEALRNLVGVVHHMALRVGVTTPVHVALGDAGRVLAEQGQQEEEEQPHKCNAPKCTRPSTYCETCVRVGNGTKDWCAPTPADDGWEDVETVAGQKFDPAYEWQAMLIDYGLWFTPCVGHMVSTLRYRRRPKRSSPSP